MDRSIPFILNLQVLPLIIYFPHAPLLALKLKNKKNKTLMLIALLIYMAPPRAVPRFTLKLKNPPLKIKK